MWLIAVLSILSAFGIWVWQGYTWLKTGEVPSLLVSAVFVDRKFGFLGETGWIGIDRMSDAFMHWPLSFTLVGVAFLFLWLSMRYD